MSKKKKPTRQRRKEIEEVKEKILEDNFFGNEEWTWEEDLETEKEDWYWDDESEEVEREDW